MAYSEDHIALAAEYALGTLDADERAQVETMMAVDTDFAAVVQAWEFRLGALNQMVGAVEPRPELWERIRAAIGQAEPQAPIVLPEALAAAAPRRTAPGEAVISAQVAPPVTGDSNVIRLTAQARRWRTIASAMTALAAALIAMLAVEVYKPNLLPGALRSKPQVQVVEVRTPQTGQGLSGQYVAILQGQAGAPAFILTVDATTKNFTVRKVGASPEPGKSFELWLISDKLPRPRSLGVIGGSDFTARPVLSGYDQDVINGATYAVTVEQAGGSPDGVPHSTPIYTGKLIETVPPTTSAPNR
ncbi:anti-sigma factor [Bradyrhizobium sp.]|uniref:anti-sigma factor n=1 Tax=Bradyrhizobium sp. TaxID=376 RepID=UPI001DD63BF3|nr:anti-sigma factor [Bradyrhizobium sp.]MBV8700567.1 anti-sigma factor [Bradyrhizobium sp.]MBV8921596.1 anti-sigma factor [Bradyrhizobium sp.]